jgi:hypothetical protein
VTSGTLLSLPFQPTIDSSTSRRASFVSRSRKPENRRLSQGNACAREVDQHCPLIAAQASSDHVFDALISHRVRILQAMRSANRRWSPEARDNALTGDLVWSVARQEGVTK